ncbi:MAG TPA: gliding motility-associated ABC transporter substrate-binding protein GldG [Chitinophagaceae bacterium]|nr:gliding motility-associated ABC transporter substrate-binding protein GldG [Chitinophagaceae bacterium]
MIRTFRTKYGWLLLLFLLFAINLLVAFLPAARIDLTGEKRYTLSRTTRELARSLREELQIDVFLKGEFPSGFRKLAGSTQDFLRLLREQNPGRISFRFISPLDEMPGTGAPYADTLRALGAVPINLTVQRKEGESSNIIFPVALLSYQGRQALVSLYPGASNRISQEEINSAEAVMEYQFVKSIDRLVREKRSRIGYAVGNGEPVDERTWDLVQTLSQDYDFGIFNLREQPAVPRELDVLMVVKPSEPFTEDQKLKLDQYVMGGGKLLFFVDNLFAEQDSLSFKPETIAFDRNLNLTDLLFRYGVRINTDLVMDLQCDLIPLVVGGTLENPQFEFLRWNYFPLFATGGNRLVNRNMGYVAGRFVNSVDSIQVSGVKKYVILSSSPNSRIISTPALISLNENRNAPEDEKFKTSAIPAGMLLEGIFTSLYRNRVSQAQRDTLGQRGMEFRNASPENKMIVVADGDMVLNDLTPQGPLPMGWNRYTYREYENQTEAGRFFVPVANREFLLSCVEYLLSNSAIIETRNKEIVLRLLNSRRVSEQRTRWQLLNIAVPVALVVLAGFGYQQLRRRRFAS